MKRAAALLMPCVLAACAVGPNYRAPEPLGERAATLNEVAGNPTVSDAAAQPKWWRLFDDAVLDRLIERALVHNTDLRVASANLQRARALLAEAGAARLPVANANAAYNRLRITSGSSVASGSGTGSFPAKEIDFYSVGFDASYEIDLFGGVTRSIQAAHADREAAAAALDAARVSVAAEVARSYAQLCGFAAQEGVARETAELQTKTLDLTQRLLSGGRGTRREVDQAALLVEQANAQVPQFEAERRAALYALAVLTGDPPAEADRDAAGCVTPPRVGVPIPVGDGRALLARRPDVRQAERALARDVARVGVATAALYPSINLLGSVISSGISTGVIGTGDSVSFALGPSISWNFPPFNGAARARVRAAGAEAEASLARFDKAVLTALQETEQALARLKGAAEREAALARALAASENAAKLTRIRFDYGSDNFLQLLDAERSRADTRAALADARTARAEAEVSLFKALGGGWEDAPEVERIRIPK